MTLSDFPWPDDDYLPDELLDQQWPAIDDDPRGGWYSSGSSPVKDIRTFVNGLVSGYVLQARQYGKTGSVHIIGDVYLAPKPPESHAIDIEIGDEMKKLPNGRYIPIRKNGSGPKREPFKKKGRYKK